MVENQFSIGDLVAHKHYPEQAIGHITQFYPSGRVGISGDRARSFLPKNLVLVTETQISKELAKEITGSENTHRGWAEARAAEAAAKAAAKAAAIEKETNELIKMLEKKLAASQTEAMELPPVSPTPLPTPPVSPAQAQTKELAEHSENCSQCRSQDIRRFHYHDPKEHYFYCRNCGHEGWGHTPTEEPKIEHEEELDAMATPAKGISTECCENDPCIDCDDYCNCSDCSESEGEDTESEVMEIPPLEVKELEDAIAPGEVPPLEVEGVENAIAAQADLELPPIPRDFSELNIPEWWERPILPEVFKCEEDDDDDGEEWWVLVEPGYFKAKYRSWELLIDEGYQIYATPPKSNRTYHCECELDLDGPDGQITIAQEFIDSWYFAQPSPGQLSLNISEAVARDPPPRFR
ncbi:hypothetical protein [Kamptonema sp. UHCC 0994]|uniref:hypothetical protein n=1 Tax=Kamptonema sp. UHCC 0994 TaxID=3031329 RepID=UPI0023BA278F|nr:hypothetical protein [Kamptonema sp. UHCC 0994]MDF0551699.1 hypothetical protein [Kamptonema sp. UHCC 0994]